MPQYQSLYRRFRPQRFSEVKGQDHVVNALRNAVRDERVGHAFMFSGPRGTGKTSSARILAKALNCLNIQDGEPCCECESCLAIQQGTSLDVHELDAASNNGVEAMRDLVSRTALGTPGRWKVYIIDEVHMLSTAASNALLKTLEEPPAHVIFVLATTDPQKVLPTIRSRTQHFEFRLLPADVLADLVKDVQQHAHIDVADEAIDFVVRRGHGSARDALSLLDQVAAAGSAHDTRELLDDIIEGFIENDTSRVLVAVAESIHAGSDARRLTTDIVEHLRNAFLSTMSKGLVPLPDEALERVASQASQLGVARTVRIMETLGQALIDMRDTVDPRLTLEVALIRATTVSGGSDGGGAGTGNTELLDRLSRLEQRVASLSQGEGTASNSTPQSSGRPSLGAMTSKTSQSTSRTTTTPRVNAAPPTGVVNNVANNPNAPVFNRDELVKAWGDTLLEQLPQRARARFRSGHFVSVDGNTATFEVQNRIHKDRCNEICGEVEQVVSGYFATKIKIDFVIEDAPVAKAEAETQITNEQDESIDLSDTREAPDQNSSVESRLKEMFPGAEEVS